MKPKTRYNIGLVQRKGVTVQTVGRETPPEFYALYCQTARRNGFKSGPFNHFSALFQGLAASPDHSELVFLARPARTGHPGRRHRRHLRQGRELSTARRPTQRQPHGPESHVLDSHAPRPRTRLHDLRNGRRLARRGPVSPILRSTASRPASAAASNTAAAPGTTPWIRTPTGSSATPNGCTGADGTPDTATLDDTKSN